jgi:hypothetical protein
VVAAAAAECVVAAVCVAAVVSAAAASVAAAAWSFVEAAIEAGVMDAVGAAALA